MSSDTGVFAWHIAETAILVEQLWNVIFDGIAGGVSQRAEITLSVERSRLTESRERVRRDDIGSFEQFGMIADL